MAITRLEQAASQVVSVERQTADELTAEVVTINGLLVRAAQLGLKVDLRLDQLQGLGAATCPVLQVEVYQRLER